MATITLPSKVTFGSPENPMLTIQADEPRLDGQSNGATVDIGPRNDGVNGSASSQDPNASQTATVPQILNGIVSDAKDLLADAASMLPGDIVDEVRYHLRYQPAFIRSVEKLVKAFKYEQADHDVTKADLRDAQGKLQSLRARLFQVETEFRRTKNELDIVKDNLAMVTLQLQNALNDLEDTKGDLERALKELQERKAELVQVRDELASALADLLNAEKKLQEAENKLQKRTAELDQAKRDLAKTRTDLQKLVTDNAFLETDNKRLKQDLADSQKREKDLAADNRRYVAIVETLKQQLYDANTEADNLRAENAVLEKDNDESLREIVSLRQQNSALTARLNELGNFFHYPERVRGDFYIDEVVYGGQVIDDQDVIDKLLDYAGRDEQFTINNELMKTDPWERVPKSFTAAYAYKGRGPFMYISSREGTEVQFTRPSESNESAPEDLQGKPADEPTLPNQPSQPADQGNVSIEPPQEQSDPVTAPGEPAVEQPDSNAAPVDSNNETAAPIGSTEPVGSTGAAEPVGYTRPAESAGFTTAEPVGYTRPVESVGYNGAAEPSGFTGQAEPVQYAIPSQPIQTGLPRQTTGSFPQRQPYQSGFSYATRQPIPVGR